MAAQEPVIETAAKPREYFPALRRVLRKCGWLHVCIILLLAALIAALQLDFTFSSKAKTDEERYAAIKSIEKRWAFLESGKGRWIDRSFEFVRGESLYSTLALERHEHFHQLEQSGFMTILPIPLVTTNDYQGYTPLWRAITDRIDARSKGADLSQQIFWRSDGSNVFLLCPKQDVPGWQQFFSTLATNSPPVAQSSP
jgi:hypothetical protein